MVTQSNEETQQILCEFTFKDLNPKQDSGVMHHPKQAKTYPNLDLKHDMCDSIQQSSGKSLQTFYSTENPETLSTFPERLETSVCVPLWPLFVEPSLDRTGTQAVPIDGISIVYIVGWCTPIEGGQEKLRQDIHHIHILQQYI